MRKKKRVMYLKSDVTFLIKYNIIDVTFLIKYNALNIQSILWDSLILLRTQM